MTPKPARLSDLTPDPNNANRGTERGRYMVGKALEKLGAGRSVLVDKNGVLIAGNKTTEAAYDLGMEEIIIVPTDGTRLVVVQRTDLDLATDPKAKELAIADNRAGEVGLEWDAVVVTDTHAQVDLGDWFLDHELEEFAVVDAPTQPAKPDARKELKRKAGQVKLVLHIEEVGTLEAAIAATGLSNRAEAITAIAQSYLDHHGSADWAR